MGRKVGVYEFKKSLKNDLGLKNRDEAKYVLEDIDAVIETAVRNLKPDENVNIGSYIKLRKEIKKGRSGDSPRLVKKGVYERKEFNTDDHEILKIEFTNSGKKLLEIVEEEE